MRRRLRLRSCSATARTTSTSSSATGAPTSAGCQSGWSVRTAGSNTTASRTTRSFSTRAPTSRSSTSAPPTGSCGSRRRPCACTTQRRTSGAFTGSSWTRAASKLHRLWATSWAITWSCTTSSSGRGAWCSFATSGEASRPRPRAWSRPSLLTAARPEKSTGSATSPADHSVVTLVSPTARAANSVRARTSLDLAVRKDIADKHDRRGRRMLPLAVLSTGRGLALDLVEKIFVLAVARDQRPLSLVLPHDEFDPVQGRVDGDERDGPVVVLAGGDLALPFADVEEQGPGPPQHSDVAERRIPVARRELGRLRRVRRHAQPLPLLGNGLLPRLGGGREVPFRFRTPVEDDFQEAAQKWPAQPLTSVGVREDHGADPVLGQPHHVAVIPGQIPAVVHDDDAPGPVLDQPHPVTLLLAEKDLRNLAGAEVLLRDQSAAVGQLAASELQQHVLGEIVCARPRSAGRPDGDHGIVQVHLRSRHLAVDVGAVRPGEIPFLRAREIERRRAHPQRAKDRKSTRLSSSHLV